jgi:hypothetical protein
MLRQRGDPIPTRKQSIDDPQGYEDDGQDKGLPMEKKIQPLKEQRSVFNIKIADSQYEDHRSTRLLKPGIYLIQRNQKRCN